MSGKCARLFSKYNYRIRWFDGWENNKLILDNYNSGPAAPYQSWVLLEKVGPVETQEQAEARVTAANEEVWP